MEKQPESAADILGIPKKWTDEIPPEWAARDAEVRRLLAAEEAEKQHERDKALLKIRAKLGIPKDFLELIDGGPLHQTEPMRAIGAEPFGLLVLSGDVGRGKSIAAVSWLIDGLVDGPRLPLFVTAARLSRWDRYDNEQMNMLLRAPRLVIDDLGNEYQDAKGNFQAVLDELVADRIANKRPTIVTTNLLRDVFIERYGARIRDRIRGGGRWETFAGESFRGRQLGLLPADASHR